MEETEVWAISVDGPEMQQAMIDRIIEEGGGEPPFYRMLTDEDHRVIDRYGLFNPGESRGRPVPHPTVFVIDKAGVVQYAQINDSPGDLPDFEAIKTCWSFRIFAHLTRRWR